MRENSAEVQACARKPISANMAASRLQLDHNVIVPSEKNLMGPRVWVSSSQLYQISNWRSTSNFFVTYLKLIPFLIDSNECSINGACDQMCNPQARGKKHCDCVLGYTKKGSRCFAINGKHDFSPYFCNCFLIDQKSHNKLSFYCSSRTRRNLAAVSRRD